MYISQVVHLKSLIRCQHSTGIIAEMAGILFNVVDNDGTVFSRHALIDTDVLWNTGYVRIDPRIYDTPIADQFQTCEFSWNISPQMMMSKWHACSTINTTYGYNRGVKKIILQFPTCCRSSWCANWLMREELRQAHVEVLHSYTCSKHWWHILLLNKTVLDVTYSQNWIGRENW